jgi:hypothetical protein
VHVFLINAESSHSLLSIRHSGKDTVSEMCLYTISVCVARGGYSRHTSDTNSIFTELIVRGDCVA